MGSSLIEANNWLFKSSKTGSLSKSISLLPKESKLLSSGAEFNQNLKIKLSLELGDKFLEEKFIEVQKTNLI